MSAIGLISYCEHQKIEKGQRVMLRAAISKRDEQPATVLGVSLNEFYNEMAHVRFDDGSETLLPAYVFRRIIHRKIIDITKQPKE